MIEIIMTMRHRPRVPSTHRPSDDVRRLSRRARKLQAKELQQPPRQRAQLRLYGLEKDLVRRRLRMLR